MGMSPAPSSFGQRREQKPPEPVVMLPPVMMPPVQLPVVLRVDVESLQVASAQIQEMVAAAVRAGFAEAMAEYDPDTMSAPVGFDPAAEPADAQMAHLRR